MLLVLGILASISKNGVGWGASLSPSGGNQELEMNEVQAYYK